MFGKLGMVVAGVVTAGLLATGMPASASTIANGAGTAGVHRGQATIEQLAKQAGVTDLRDLVRVTVTRSDLPTSMSPLVAQATGPYTVWVVSQVPVPLTVRLYWEEKGVAGVFGGADAPLNAMSTASYQIAGPNGCNVLNRYLLQIYYQGQLALQMGPVWPSSADGDICQDAWGIGYN